MSKVLAKQETVETVTAEQADKDSLDSPTKIKKMVSVESGSPSNGISWFFDPASPTKISNYEMSNDLETPCKLDKAKGLKIQTEETSPAKYQTPSN